jgi:hypothetical protein
MALVGLPLAMGCGSPSPRPTPSPSQEARPFEVGGSNYVMYSVGEYVTDPRDEIWVRDVRPVIGAYHLDPATVKQQLLTMFANGQRRLSLVLWFTDLSPFPAIAMNETYGHSVNSRLGRLAPTQEANLRSVLRLIREDGYLEVVFRFATQDGSAPWEWSEWNEGAYLKNLSFISTTRDTVEQELGASPVAVTYDLDAELGGRVDGQSRPYLVRLWGDCARRFGTTRTVAFSVVASRGRLSQLIRDLDQTGLRPPEYTVDVYGDEGSRLAFVGEELRAANEGGKPLIVLEVYYNDATTARSSGPAARFPRSAPSSSGSWSGARPRTTSRSTIPSGSRTTSPSSSERRHARRSAGARADLERAVRRQPERAGA